MSPRNPHVGGQAIETEPTATRFNDMISAELLLIGIHYE
jgi:hypothetical protein